MKIWDIIKEDFEPKQQIKEGWKENILATVIGVASLFGNVKGQDKAQNTANISVSQQVTNDSITLDIGRVFKSGKYLLSDEDYKALAVELRKFGNKVLKNPTSDFLIEIVASESKVPNYDMEPSSPTYKQELDTRVLSEKRVEPVQFALINFINLLKKDGVLKGNVKFVEPTILIGDAPWPMVDKSTGVKKDADDPIYTKDQYVFVKIKIEPNKDVKTVPFNAYADIGEAIYLNGKTIGLAFTSSRGSQDVTKSGNKNTAYENVLFKMVKPDTPLSGRKDEKGVYTKSFVIPSDWWNSHISNKTLTEDDLNYIVANFDVFQ